VFQLWRFADRPLIYAKKSIHPLRFAGHEAIAWVRMRLAAGGYRVELPTCLRTVSPAYSWELAVETLWPGYGLEPATSLVSLSLCV